MAFLNMTTLEQWIADFREVGPEIRGTVRVVVQDGDGGADTGLVAATLATVQTTLFIQPEHVGSDRWCVTFEPRDEPASMDAMTVRDLASELSVMAELCTYLQQRASEQAEPDVA